MSSSVDRIVNGPGRAFAAGIEVPGDKSLSHRAVIMAAMAEGVSTVERLATGADVTASLNAVRQLGVEVDGPRLKSPGIDAWPIPDMPIDCGNSGTTMRLLAGALSGSSLEATLVGDESLSRRPMRRLVEPLQALGATVNLSEQGTAPITITGCSPTRAADVDISIASAQVRSAFALGAVRAEGESTIASPPGFRDHTERWFEAMGLGRKEDANTLRIYPGEVPAYHYVIPGDPSSAAFLWASAAIIEGAQVVTPNISLNPGRIGFLEVLETMGATVAGEVTGAILGDPIGTVAVTGSGLRGTTVSGALAAASIDELPLVAVVASYAEGTTRVLDAAELRAKESDRIASTVAMINSLGGGAQALEDGFEVLGIGWLEGGTIRAEGDHRIAMAGAIAATAATGPVTIAGAEAAAVSWPRFFEALEALWSSQ
ncbi:MAG: 3-phosphoshikimate 1-carboxyvinyltransferase [Acidimicrobiia bacterium]|nr:3-phosphoshikimate 1-carboxyvinyltransferase [Acidimicrobiia bacterium]